MYSIQKLSCRPDHFSFGAKMPLGAKLLKVGNQNELLTFWFQVDLEEQQKGDIIFFIFNTGVVIRREDINSRLKYIDTISFSGGQYIRHVYQII